MKEFYNKLAKLSNKDKLKLEKKYTKSASKITRAGDLLQKMGQARHRFLLSLIDLQQLNQEYLTLRNQDLTNWSSAKKRDHKKKLTAYENKYKETYKLQHELSILIERFHLKLEQKLGFTFEFSANNMYEGLYVAYACVRYDEKK